MWSRSPRSTMGLCLRTRQSERPMPAILKNKNFAAPSVFAPDALLREARRQKGLEIVEVPPVCILDPDGDLVRWLRKAGTATPFPNWPCYHAELDTFHLGGQQV